MLLPGGRLKSSMLQQETLIDEQVPDVRVTALALALTSSYGQSTIVTTALVKWRPLEVTGS